MALSWRRSLALCVAMAAIAASAPAPEPAPAPLPSDDDRPQIIEIIAPAGIDAQETLKSLDLGEPGSELSERNKRTIGILRQLFPTLTQIVEQKIQSLIGQVVQVLGPTLLTSFLGGGGGGGGGTVTGGSGTIESDEDEDEDSDGSSSSSGTSRIAISLPTYAPESTNKEGDILESSENASISSSENSEESDRSAKLRTSNDNINEPELENITTNEPLEKIDEIETTEMNTQPTTIEPEDTFDDINRIVKRSVRNLNINPEQNQLLSQAESRQSEVVVKFSDTDGKTKTLESDDNKDQDTAAQTNIDSLDDDPQADADRDKRFLNFGFGGSSGGSGGGSGNVLFDIIRRPAEGMARAAGQVFRALTGTDSIGLGITATHTAVRDLTSPAPQLVAGSGNTEQTDENAADGADAGAAKGDGYTEGIPGPITRLFIIANRGIANLIQDLILRLAQTSERIVNFKARLITSII